MRKFNANRVLGCCAPVIFEAALALLAIPAKDWWNANRKAQPVPRGSLNYPETLFILNVVAAGVIGVSCWIVGPGCISSTDKAEEDEAPNYKTLDTGTP